MNICIKLGYEGTTDCCLILYSSNKVKEFGVDSPSWLILSDIWLRTSTRKPIIIETNDPRYLQLYSLLYLENTTEDEVFHTTGKII